MNELPLKLLMDSTFDFSEASLSYRFLNNVVFKFDYFLTFLYLLHNQLSIYKHYNCLNL